MKDGIYTLDHFYDVLRDEMGEDYCELLQELVKQKIAEELEPLQNNIDILSSGFDEYRRETSVLEKRMSIDEFEQFKDDYQIDFDVQSLAIKLNDKIYEKPCKPNYSAEVAE